MTNLGPLEESITDAHLQSLRGGVTLVQIREKDVDTGEVS